MHEEYDCHCHAQSKFSLISSRKLISSASVAPHDRGLVSACSWFANVSYLATKQRPAEVESEHCSVGSDCLVPHDHDETGSAYQRVRSLFQSKVTNTSQSQLAVTGQDSCTFFFFFLLDFHYWHHTNHANTKISSNQNNFLTLNNSFEVMLMVRRWMVSPSAPTLRLTNCHGVWICIHDSFVALRNCGGGNKSYQMPVST